MPSCSDPAIGCPPTNRASATASTIDAFTDPTSVTRPGPAANAARASSATARTGIATKVTAASASSPTASRAPSASAREARAGSRSRPVTCQPTRRSRMPIDPPTRPVPTTTARPGSGGRPSTTSESARQVVAQVARTLEVHVVQLVAGDVGHQVDHHADAPGGAAIDVELACAHERHVAQAELAGRLGRERRPEVVGSREQHADQVVVLDRVALKESLEQGDHPFEQMVLLVDVDGGRTPQGSHGGWHGESSLEGAPTAHPWPERPGAAGAKSGRQLLWCSAAQPPSTKHT